MPVYNPGGGTRHHRSLPRPAALSSPLQRADSPSPFSRSRREGPWIVPVNLRSSPKQLHFIHHLHSHHFFSSERTEPPSLWERSTARVRGTVPVGLAAVRRQFSPVSGVGCPSPRSHRSGQAAGVSSVLLSVRSRTSVPEVPQKRAGGGCQRLVPGAQITRDRRPSAAQTTAGGRGQGPRGGDGQRRLGERLQRIPEETSNLMTPTERRPTHGPVVEVRRCTQYLFSSCITIL